MKILIFQFPNKMNLSDTYLQRFDPPNFDTKHALKTMFSLLFCLNWCSVKRFFFSISLSTVSEKWAHVPCSLRYFLVPQNPGRPSSLSIHHFHHFRLPRNFGNNYEFYGRRQRQISSIFSFGSYTEKVHKIRFGEVQIVRCIETNFL